MKGKNCDIEGTAIGDATGERQYGDRIDPENTMELS